MADFSSPLPVALIPAFRPSSVLLGIVDELRASPEFAGIVVVDDGSGEPSAALFAQLASTPGVCLMRHHVRLGKGAALKTGLNAIALGFPESAGVVTLDAHGQHHVDDVALLARTLAADPQRLIIGCRPVPATAPLGKRLGMFTTRTVMRAIGGLKLSDSQSGLRGIPRSLLPQLLRLRTVGYDFELDMLLVAKHQGTGIVEVPIRRLDVDGEPGRHFNPVRDSLRIYYVFLRFNLSSMAAFLVDYSLFALLHLAGASLAFSQFGARAVSSLFNYLVNRHFVFKADQASWGSLLLYYATVVLVAACSYGLILLMSETLDMSVYLAKLIADTGLYIASFAIQREFVFRRRADEEMND